MTRLLRLLIAVTLLAPGLPAAAVELGNVAAGLEYAQKVCSECHAVDKDDTAMVIPEVPSFQEVADTTGMTPRALVVWLTTSHPNMPDLIIPPDDMDNVVAYIMSLRTTK
jgi:mono/diheme cytochrome c family protein